MQNLTNTSFVSVTPSYILFFNSYNSIKYFGYISKYNNSWLPLPSLDEIFKLINIDLPCLSTVKYNVQ